MNRSLAVAAVAFVACIALVPALVATDASAQQNTNVTTINSCTEITEPGEYKLTADIQSSETDACIEIHADDVTLRGSDHTITGPGGESAETDGIWINASNNGEIAVRNVRVEEWKNGIYADGGGSLEFTEVSASDNGDNGIHVSETGDVVITSSTFSSNGEDGVSLTGHGQTFVLTDLQMENNEGNGIATSGTDGSITLTDSYIRGYGEEGVVYMWGGTITDSTVIGREGVYIQGDGEIENSSVEVSTNPNLDARDGTVTATGLEVGDSVTAEFSDESAAFEPVPREEHVREGGLAVGDGVNIIGDVDGPIVLELNVETEDEAVDLWRHDGSSWETVRKDLPVADGSIEASVNESGTYAPGIEDPGPRPIDSCTNITELGEYELVEDIQTDEADTCIGIQADDVVLDGNGHVLEGPGRDEGSIAINQNSDGRNFSLEVRNVEIVGWYRAFPLGGPYNITNTVIRDNARGLYVGAAEITLTDVVIENNDGWGIDATMAEVSGTNVTIRENEGGIVGGDGGHFTFESSRIVDNNGTGAAPGHYSRLELTDSTVSGNDGPGIKSAPINAWSRATLENTTVADNAGDGIRAPGDTTVQLSDVTVENNAGLAVSTHPGEHWHVSSGSITAANLAVGPSATLTVDEEPLQASPVTRDDLQPRNDGTLVGDGLNISNNVSNSIALELDVETDDDTVDLWRYDGSEWETVEKDLPVDDGSIAVSVDENGTYAPGTMEDEANADEHVLTIESTESTPAMHYRIVSSGPIEAGEDLEDHDDISEEDGNWVIEGQVGPPGTDDYHVTAEELESVGVWYIDTDADPVNYTDDPVPADTFSLQWDGEAVHPDDIAAETDVGEADEEEDDSDGSDDADEGDDDSRNDFTIDSCTDITEPGEYELIEDIQSDEEDSCIVIHNTSVVLDGNGHTIEGPGGDEGSVGLVPMGVVRNVEITGWDAGITSPTSYELENAVVRDNNIGLDHSGSGGNALMRNVTIANNDDLAITASRGGANGTNVTIRENGAGIHAFGGVYTFESSRIVDNERYGAKIHHHSWLDLTNTTVSSNGGHGIDLFNRGMSIHANVEDSTVSDNGGDGIRAGGKINVELTDIVVENNAGRAVNETSDSPVFGPSAITVTNLAVGSSATVSFDEERVRLDSVVRGQLPTRTDGSVAGDGLYVFGNVSDSVEMELDVETDNETVDLWRYDGSQWETVEEDLPVTDGSIAASVDKNGTYAPGIQENSRNETVIDSCTNITEPGEYELVDDVQTDEVGTCLRISAEDVDLDGNGHTIEGPGGEEDSTGIVAGDGVAIRNVEITGWDAGIAASGHYQLENAVVRENRLGLDHSDRSGSATLMNVVIENNAGVGITEESGAGSGTNVTIRENGAGISLTKGSYDFESSHIVDNEGDGVRVAVGGSITLIDTTVSGNGEHGIFLFASGSGMHTISASIEGGTISDNGGDGIYLQGVTDTRLDDVTVENNGGLAVNATHEDNTIPPTDPITITNLHIGRSASITFDNESLRLDPVDRGDLQPRDAGTVAGDGLDVSGTVSDSIDLELAVDTDDETVDLWRYDGSEWETVEEDLSVADGSIAASVDENGTYAPGTMQNEQESSEDNQDDSDESDDADESSDDEADDSERSDDSDTSEDDSRDDADGSDDTDESDDDSQDGSDETDGSTESDGTEESDDEETGGEEADTSDETDDSDSSDDQETDDEGTDEEADDSRDESGESDDDQSSDEESTDEDGETGDDETEADEQTESGDDGTGDDESAEDDPETGDDGGAAIADDEADTLAPEVPESDPVLGEEGPGFGLIVPLVAVVSAGLLAYLRREI